MQQEVKNVILDSITEGVFTVDLNWHITSFNRAAEKITGITSKQAIGQNCRDILRADVCEADCALRRTIQTGSPVINKPVHIIDSQGNKKAVNISTALLKSENGKIIGGVETFRDITLEEELKKEIKKKYSFEDIISRNHKVQELFDVLPQIAKSDCTVLIEGDTGTGKELFARAIHNVSNRNNKPFIPVNCSALPDSLLESELFGYKAGAFTDAKTDKPGRFNLAQGGTVFLDEIGDISPSVQVKLLRVLQEKTFEPVGAVTTQTADVRIITATNKSLSQLVEEGSFRSDLFYRINVVKLSLPRLKERAEDIPLLIDHFIHRFNNIYNKNISSLSNDALTALLTYEYPGNIRELENIIEHAFVLCDSQTIELKHLPVSVRPPSQIDQSALQQSRTLKQMEKLMIEQALRRNNGNKKQAAKELGIDPSTLFRKIKSLK